VVDVEPGWIRQAQGKSCPRGKQNMRCFGQQGPQTLRRSKPLFMPPKSQVNSGKYTNGNPVRN
jgi:hypothetical protein